MKTLKIISVNISDKKGISKSPVESIELTDTGVKGDAHAGEWHRQVSILGVESIDKASKQAGEKIKYGDFAENITSEGIELHHANIFDRLKGKDIELEITQIGKKCHKGCAIMKKVGDCVMPNEGIFCRVISGGKLSAGDKLEYHPKIVHVKIITMSDRADKGIYEDKSGPLAEKLLTEFLQQNNRPFKIEKNILPDKAKELTSCLEEAKNQNHDIIITTGGTGIGPNDITPDVVKPMLDKKIPGIMELIRVKYGMDKPNALISRSIAGVIGKSLVYVLPGSVKAVEEYMKEIIPTIEHSMRMVHGIDSH